MAFTNDWQARAIPIAFIPPSHALAQSWGLRGLTVSKSCAEKAGDISKNVAKESDKGLVEGRTHGEK